MSGDEDNAAELIHEMSGRGYDDVPGEAKPYRRTLRDRMHESVYFFQRIIIVLTLALIDTAIVVAIVLALRHGN